MLSKMFATTALASAILFSSAATAQTTDQERVFDNQSYVFPNANNDTPTEETTGVYNLDKWS